MDNSCINQSRTVRSRKPNHTVQDWLRYSKQHLRIQAHSLPSPCYRLWIMFACRAATTSSCLRFAANSAHPQCPGARAATSAASGSAAPTTWTLWRTNEGVARIGPCDIGPVSSAAGCTGKGHILAALCKKRGGSLTAVLGHSAAALSSAHVTGPAGPAAGRQSRPAPRPADSAGGAGRAGPGRRADITRQPDAARRALTLALRCTLPRAPLPPHAGDRGYSFPLPLPPFSPSPLLPFSPSPIVSVPPSPAPLLALPPLPCPPCPLVPLSRSPSLFSPFSIIPHLLPSLASLSLAPLMPSCLKNGRVVSTKYDSKTIFFPIPHVIFFANFEPDYTKWSADLYNVIKLGIM